MRAKFCEIRFACLKYVRCIETQTNNMGCEKCIWDITGTHRHKQTDRQTDTHKHTHRQHGISQNTFFLVWKVA